MTWKPMVGASALLLAAALLPAAAYHIDPIMLGAAPTMPSDWTTAGGVAVITCESNGPLEDGYQSPSGSSLQGGGGLCRTGENDATGRYPPGATALLPASIPAGASRIVVRIDACDAQTAARNGGANGPYGPTGPTGVGADDTCATGSSNNNHWTAQIGVFQCEVPTAFSLAVNNPSGGDWALYYDNLYAWWNFETYGDGVYTAGDPIDTANSGDGAPNGLLDLDNVDDYHGHVAMFIDPTQSNAASITGSAVTIDGTTAQILLNTAAGLVMTDDPGAFPAAVTTNNCGASPACPSGGSPCDPTATGFSYGPVVRMPDP